MEIKINLIPPYRKEEIAKAKLFRKVIQLGIAILSIFIFFYLFLFGLYETLEIELASVSGYQEMNSGHSQYGEIKKFDEEFERINGRTKQIMTISNDQLYWSNLFFHLSGSIISGIEMTDLSMNDYAIFLSGTADNRDNLIIFKDKLATDDCFSDVNLPLSNLVSKENVAFQIDLNIKEECLKRR